MKRTPTIYKLAGNRWLGLVLILAFALALVPANQLRVSATTAPTLALSSANPAHMSAATTALDRLRASPASVASAPTTCPAANTVYPSVPPNAIQIDPSADLYSCLNTGGNPLNDPAATADWVKDTNPNTDTPALNSDIATGVNTAPTANLIQTGAAAVGHWNGDRIVDGIATADQDIFLTGGKENDTTTWNVGPGSVGSSKYDITQAYLSNNQTNLYFGMERAGNNGTTAFDFEFNQKAPQSTYIPTRTVGDILFTFEMQGSGGSGSATPHYFTWNGSAYVEQNLPSSLKSSINLSSTPGEPWGFVNSKGVWTTGNIDNFVFAEASVNLTQAFPGFSGCTGTSFFVEVRTRSSAGATSDLKDTTKIFKFTFGGPTAAATLTAGCTTFKYDGTGSTDSNGGTAVTYNWLFTVSPNTVTLSGGGVTAGASSGQYTSTQQSGTVNVTLPSGVPSATITAVNQVTQSGTTCTASSTQQTVTVYSKVGGTITLTPSCDSTFQYSAAGSGGLAPYSYSIQIQKPDGSGGWTNVGSPITGKDPSGSTGISGTLDANNYGGDGTYRAEVTITDSQTTPCTAVVDSSSIDVRNALVVGASKTGADGSLLSVTLTGTAAEANNDSIPSGDSVTYQWQRLSGANWVGIGNASATLSTLTYSSFETDGTATPLTNVTINGSPYNGTEYGVQIRLEVVRTLNGANCTKDSTPVTVKKVIAVDP